MSTVAFQMPNEGHLGGFDIRRFLQKYMTVGLMISIGFHLLVIAGYHIGVYIASQGIPPPTRVIYLDPSNLGPPPSLSGEDTAPSLKIAQPKLAPPAAAIPKPVAEEIAPEEPVIQTQEQLAQNLDATSDSLLGLAGGGEDLQIAEAIPMEDAIPDPGVFTPYEKAPALIKKIDPKFPSMAQTAGVGGKVTVQFYVDKSGDVKKAQAVKANPAGLGFEEAAVEAVLQWKFTPALQRENPVGVWVAQVITFKVQ
jgi:TonB family protein